jgi:MFS family permease
MRLVSASLFRQRDFARLWAAQGISQIGTQISMLTLPLIAAITLDASAFEVGLLAAAGQAPALVFGLFAGAWLDRRRRRPVMISADLGRAALFTLVPLAAWLDLLSMPLLAAIAFAAGTLTILFDIGYLSYLPTLVGKRELVGANSALEATTSAAQVAGPGIGGGLVALVGGPTALLVDAASFLLSGALIGRIRQPEPEPSPDAVPRRLVAQVREGVGYVHRQPVLRSLLGVSMITNLFGFAFMAVYVLYLVRDLDLNSSEVGFVFAAGGVGALIGSVLATRLQERFGAGPVLIWSQCAFGATGMLVPVAVLAPSIALPMIVAAEFLQWLALLVYTVNAISLRQRLSDDAIQGRVHATFVFVARGLQPVGSLIGGALGVAIGLPLTLVVAELGMFAAFFWLLLSPVRHFRPCHGESGTIPEPVLARAE